MPRSVSCANPAVPIPNKATRESKILRMSVVRKAAVGPEASRRDLSRPARSTPTMPARRGPATSLRALRSRNRPPRRGQRARTWRGRRLAIADRLPNRTPSFVFIRPQLLRSSINPAVLSLRRLSHELAFSGMNTRTHGSVGFAKRFPLVIVNILLTRLADNWLTRWANHAL
jgi:hypothetical protein